MIAVLRSLRFRAVAAFSRLRTQNLALAGLIIAILCIAIASLAPILPLPDPNATNLAIRLQPPLSGHGILGTDGLGRDVAARLAFGMRTSLAVGAAATLAAAVAGSAIGLVAAFYGRIVDAALMRSIDVLMAFPYLLLALAVVAALGTGLANAAIAIAIVNVPFFARAVRGAALSVVGRDYVDAARMAGLSDLRILVTEILPNVMPLIVVTTTTTMGWMILETAGLSFLGLGAQPPQADLGSMLAEGRTVVVSAPHLAAAPGVAIFVLVVGLNLLGDGLRDLIDPRMGQGAGAPAPATAVDRGRTPDAADSDALLVVRGLTTAFETPTGRHAAVRDVSLVLARGEALGIVGESGSGKSVAALSLTRLAPSPPGVVTAGTVRLDGVDLVGASFEELRKIRGARVAYVFQDPSTTLNPLTPVGAQVAEAVAAHSDVGRGDAKEKALALLADVRLPDPERLFARHPHELSGGQRQRIAIAMALAGDPDVVVADEPTTALDATTQARALELFSTLRETRGAALIFVSHDFGVIEALCERVAVMYAGEIVEEGPTKSVLAEPRHPYTARLLACAPRFGDPDRVLEAIEGAPPPIDNRPKGCAFAPRCRLAIDECRAGPIALGPIGEGRAVRCIRSDEVANGRS